jgi:hypothetical protein
VPLRSKPLANSTKVSFAENLQNVSRANDSESIRAFNQNYSQWRSAFFKVANQQLGLPSDRHSISAPIGRFPAAVFSS